MSVLVAAIAALSIGFGGGQADTIAVHRGTSFKEVVELLKAKAFDLDVTGITVDAEKTNFIDPIAASSPDELLTKVLDLCVPPLTFTRQGSRYKVRLKDMLSVQKGTPFTAVLLQFRGRGLKIDDSAIDVVKISTHFDGNLYGRSLEDLLAQALDRCTPNLEIERNGDTFVLSYQKASAGEDLTQLDVKAGTSAYEAIQLLVHKGMKVDFSQVAWKQHNFTEPDSFGNRYNILREPIWASSNEDALNQILALTRPAVAYDRAGDVYQLHYAYPIVHKKIDANESLAQVLRDVSAESGFELVDQTPAYTKVKVPKFQRSERFLDEFLTDLSTGSDPRLEVLDLDPAAKKGRVVLATFSGTPLILAQPGHLSAIEAVETDRDGNYCVTEGREGTINIWNARQRTTIRSYIGKVAHNGFSADGKKVLVCRDGTMARFNFEKLNVRETIGTPGGRINSLSYSAAKDWAASGSDDGNVYLTDLKTSKSRMYAQPAGVKRCVISPDGNRMAVWLSDPKVGELFVVVWNLAGTTLSEVSATNVATITTKGKVQHVDFSPDSKRIVVSSDPGDVAVYTVDGNPLSVPGANSNVLISNTDPQNPQNYPVRFSPNSQTLAVAKGNDSITFYDLQTGATTAPIHRDSKRGSWLFNAFAWLNEDQVVAGIDANELARPDDKLAIYDRNGNAEVLKGQTEPIRDLAFSQDGKFLIVKEGSGIRRWDMTLKSAPTYQAADLAVPQPNNGRTPNESSRGSYVLGVQTEAPGLNFRNPVVGLAATRKVPTLKQWFYSVDERQYSSAFDSGKYPMTNAQSLFWSGDGSTFAVYKTQPNQIMVDVLNSFTPAVFDLQGPLVDAKLTADGEYLVTLSGQNLISLRIWRTGLGPYAKKNRLPSELVYPKSSGTDADKIRPQDVGAGSIAVDGVVGRFVITIGNQTWLGDSAKGPYEKSLPGSQPAFSGNGQFLALSQNGRVHLYHWESGVEVFASLPNQGQAVLSQEGDQMVTLSNNGVEAYYYKPPFKASGPQWQFNPYPVTLDRQRAPVRHVAFAYHTGFVALAGDEGTVWIYGRQREGKFNKLTTGHPLVQLRGVGPDNFVVTDVMNRYYASKGAAKEIQFSAGPAVFRYDQFDMVLNRPHEIMRTLNSESGLLDEDLVDRFEKAYLKRIGRSQQPRLDERFKFETPDMPRLINEDDIPSITTSPTLDLKVDLFDARHPLGSWKVVVQGVPESLANNGKLSSAGVEHVQVSQTVNLGPGENIIQISCANADGVESLRKEFKVRCDAKMDAPRLVYVGVGESTYGSGAHVNPLPKALPDAQKLQAFFSRYDRTQKGAFTNSPYAKVTSVVLKNASRAEVLSLKQSYFQGLRPQDIVVLYLGGHGSVSSDMQFHFLPSDYQDGRYETAVSYRDIEELVNGIGTRNKLVLLDACEAGPVDTVNASPTSPAPPTTGVTRSNRSGGLVPGLTSEFALMRELFIDLEMGSGANVISASAGGSAAYDGVFCQAVLEALASRDSKSDSNGDGQIDIQELGSYVIRRVPLINRYQAPTMRQENPQVNFPIVKLGSTTVAKPAVTKKTKPKAKSKRRGG